MSDKNHINEDELDELLRNYALNEPENSGLSEQVMKDNYDAKIDSAKEMAMLKKLEKSQGGGGWIRPFIYAGILVFIVGSLAIYFANAKYDPNKPITTNDPKPENASEAETHVMVPNEEGKLVEGMPDTFGNINRMFTVITIDSLKPLVNTQIQEEPTRMQIALPYISDDEKAKFKNIKKQMLDHLYKLHKDLYTHIDADMLDYNGKETEVNAFNIRNVAVTNLEYKTFLVDLISQGRTEEYYKAEVLSAKWKSEGCTNLAGEYFQGTKYNDFPVVNISYEGAEIFCKWLNDEFKKYISANKLKSLDIEIRMPYDKEWILAARNGYAKISYEIGYNTIYEIKEGMVDYTFVKRLNQIKKKALLRDSVYEMYIVNRYGWKEKDLTAFLDKGFGAFSSEPADTLFTDRMKLFGKIGHVSEMVPQFGTSTIWYTGFTWKSKEQYKNFEAEVKSAGASPFVGFRYVVINKSDPVYKSPFW